MTEADTSEVRSAGVWRRLGAILYDTLLIVAVLMVITAVLLLLSGGEAITRANAGWLEYGYRVLLLLCIVIFFGWFWTRRGQTLGMLAWRLQLQREDDRPITWSDALKRLAAACVSWLPLGLGYFWIWIDREQRAWHDRWTHTRVVVLPKRSRKG